MTVVEALLWPFSLIYSAAARLRAWGYRARLWRAKRLRGLVVSVGNITVGGAGKTPMAAWLAQRFSANGKKVAVLARGYRPLPPGAAGLPGDACGWNDEMALLRTRLGPEVQLGAGANRYEQGRKLEKQGVNCFLLDDGFQHLQLSRDVDIVMIDATNPFGGGRLLPCGRLREPISALRRADIVVIHRAERAPDVENTIRRYSSAPIYFSQTMLLGIEKVASGVSRAEVAPVSAHNKHFFAFCGIGNPAAFCADLKNWGVSVRGRRFFRDHHRYSQRDLALLSAEASASGAEALLCTEKDIYDLPREMATDVPVYFCKIAMQFGDEEGLWREIAAVIERKQQGRLR